MRRTKTKAAEPIDTSAGTVAYKLAMAHEADVAPRLPAGTLAALASDLIAGAGILAFARNAAVRSAFEALKPKKA